MFKLIEYFRLRRIGFSIIDAIRFNNVKIKTIEKLIVLTLALLLIANYTFKTYIVISTAVQVERDEKAQMQVQHIKANQYLNHQINEQKKKVTTLELAFISCLNNNGVVVSKRSMNCIIKDYY